jgi:tetratricopeptide (TPR) repeat protein
MLHRAVAAPDPVAPAARRAALALWGALALLSLARAALTLVPTMHAWSLNLHRFIAPAWAWIPWALAALALVPPVALRLRPAFRVAGDAIARGSWVAAVVAALMGAGLCAALPDELRFVGDFQLRQGTIDKAAAAELVFPQAMPLDRFLHVTLPLRLMGAGRHGENWAPRALGALEAGLLALLALAFARALGLRGTPAVATAAALFFGGQLGFYTGYSKVGGELALLTVAVAVAGVRAVREGRGLLLLGVAVALGCALHRSALGFLPAAVLAFAFALRERPFARREPATWLAIALPAGALALTLGRIVHTFTTFDPAMNLSAGEMRVHGVWSALFSGARAFDLPNVVVVLAPLAPALPLVALAWGRRLPADRAALLLAVLGLPFLALLLVVRPHQGMFRDYDTYSSSAMAIALLTAWLVGETLRRAPALAWVGVAVTLAVATAGAQWLAGLHDVDRGLVRITALLTEPPVRSSADRGTTWDFLGERNYNRQRWDEAALAFGRASEDQPSARVLIEWAMAETMRGDLHAAKRLYARAIDRDSTYARAWGGFGEVSMRLGDLDDAHRAALQLLRMDPNNLGLRGTLVTIEQQQAERCSSGAVARELVEQP